MSDTPRTDAEADHPRNIDLDNTRHEHLNEPGAIYQVVTADFARGLERELAQAKSELSRWHDTFSNKSPDEVYADGFAVATELQKSKAELATVIDEVFRLREELAREKGITCPQCGMTSYNLNDIKEKYCGHCHQWHEDMKK